MNMKKIFRRFGFFFLKLGGFVLDKETFLLLASMPNIEAEMLRYAKVLVKVINTECAHGTSGEYKRHIAMATLKKKFPSFTNRQIALAIEVALGWT